MVPSFSGGCCRASAAVLSGSWCLSIWLSVCLLHIVARVPPSFSGCLHSASFQRLSSEFITAIASKQWPESQTLQRYLASRIKHGGGSSGSHSPLASYLSSEVCLSLNLRVGCFCVTRKNKHMRL